MKIISAIKSDTRRKIKKVEFIGIKPLKPKKFSVELWISLINGLGASLFLQNWHPHRDEYDVNLEGEIPIEAIPQFAIDFKCFLKFDNCNDDAREAVASALMEVLTTLPTTKVVIERKVKKVFVKLILGDTEMKSELDPEWVNYLFEAP